MLSGKFAIAAQFYQNLNHAVEQDAVEQDSRPTAEGLEALLARKQDGGELDREANVELVCVLLRAEDLERFEKYEKRLIDLLGMLNEDPDLTDLEEHKVSRALDDATRRGKDKKFRRFWKKRRAF